MADTIVVPLDGSQFAEQALGVAVTLARVTGARLLLVRSAAFNYMVLPEPIGYGFVLPEMAADERLNEATDYLNALCEQYSDDSLAVSTYVADGDPASVILDAAERVNATMIVMTTHGYTGIQRWMLGSVAGKIMRHATCPVLALRSGAPPRRVLVALDGSPLAEHAIQPALLLANAFGGQLVLVRAVEDVLPSVMPRETLSMERREQAVALGVLQGEHQRVARYLDDLATRLTNEGQRVATVVGDGAAADAILAAAEQHDCDLIVMSTHGRTGVARWLLGSVTERVLSTCGRSMLVVR